MGAVHHPRAPPPALLAAHVVGRRSAERRRVGADALSRVTYCRYPLRPSHRRCMSYLAAPRSADHLPTKNPPNAPIPRSTHIRVVTFHLRDNRSQTRPGPLRRTGNGLDTTARRTLGDGRQREELTASVCDLAWFEDERRIVPRSCDDCTVLSSKSPRVGRDARSAGLVDRDFAREGPNQLWSPTSPNTRGQDVLRGGARRVLPSGRAHALG